MKRLIGVAILTGLVTACSSGQSNSQPQTGVAAFCASDNVAAGDMTRFLNTNAQADSKTPQLFFIHNISQQTINLDRKVKNGQGMSAGWGSQLAAQQWSAILVSANHFELTCADANYKPISCTQVTTACYVPQVTYQTPPQGTYWVAESLAEGDFLAALAKRGVVPQAPNS